MLGCLKSLLGKVAMALLLVLAAYAGWKWGPEVFPRVHGWLGLQGDGEPVEAEVTPEMADSVVALVQAFRRGGGPQRLAFGGRELTSVLRYGGTGLLPEGLTSPTVALSDGRVRLGARVALEAFPDLPDLGSVLGFLPDTVPVTLEASLMPFADQEAALLVHKIEASRIPLPRRLIPEILTALGRQDRPELPPEALLIPLPRGLDSAYILSDSLILSSDS